MNTLIAITAAFTLLAVFFVLSMLRHLRRRRVLRASGSLAGGAATASIGGIGIVLLTSLYSYGQLTGEQIIGQIEFAEQLPGTYTARLMIEGKIDQLYDMRGDEWQMDARVVNWKPPVARVRYSVAVVPRPMDSR